MRLRRVVLTVVTVLAAVSAMAASGVLPSGAWRGTEPDATTTVASAPPTVASDPPTVESAEADAHVDDRDAWLARGQAVDRGGLHPGLEAALDEARSRARADGVEIPVASAHRSAQEQLDTLEREISRRGSLEAALHWVFLPEDSMHVRGLAIDVNAGPAADWLQRHGAAFGLCKTLDWEWWHFEWRERWQREQSCPAPATSPDAAPPP